MKAHLGQRLGSRGWDSGGAYLAQFGVVNEVRAVSVDESAEGQPILPAGQREGGQAWDQAGALPYPGPRNPPIWMASSVKWSQVLIPCLAFKALITIHGPFPPSSS